MSSSSLILLPLKTLRNDYDYNNNGTLLHILLLINDYNRNNFVEGKSNIREIRQLFAYDDPQNFH